MKVFVITIALISVFGFKFWDVPLTNQYKAKGELYQCFIDGEVVHKSNIRPESRGGKWFLINDEVMEVDDCFCMGCIGF